MIWIAIATLKINCFLSGITIESLIVLSLFEFLATYSYQLIQRNQFLSFLQELKHGILHSTKVSSFAPSINEVYRWFGIIIKLNIPAIFLTDHRIIII